MLQRSTLFLICLMFGNMLPAQELSWSTSQKLRNKNAHATVIGENRHGIFVLRSKTKRPEYGKVLIERYRDDLSLAYSKQFHGLRNSSFEHGVATPRGFDLVSSARDEDGSEQLLVHRYNEQAVEIEAPKQLHRLSYGQGQKPGRFIVTQSFSGKRILFANVIRGGEIAVNLLITDESYNPIEEKTIDFEISDFGFRLADILIDESGNAYIIYSNYETRGFRRGEDKPFWGLVVVKADKREMRSYSLTKENVFLSRVKMSLNRANRQLTVAGFYGLKSPTGSKGTLDFALDLQTMEPLRHELIAYAYNMVVSVAGKKAADRGEELLDIELRRIVSRSDGGYLLVGEEYFITEQTYTFFINGIAQVNTRNVYNYGKVILISVGPNGEPEWEKVINKNQKSMQDAGFFTSLIVIPQKDRVDIIFNESADAMSENRIYRYYVGNRGEVQRQYLLKSLTTAVSIITRESRQIDSESVLFATTKDRKFALLRYLL